MAELEPCGSPIVAKQLMALTLWRWNLKNQDGSRRAGFCDSLPTTRIASPNCQSGGLKLLVQLYDCTIRIHGVVELAVYL